VNESKGVAASVIAIIIIIVTISVVGAYLLVTGTKGSQPAGSGENQPSGENQLEGGLPSSGPYYHRVYSATSTDGLNWTVDNTLLFDHASVPGAVYFENKLHVYFVNASDLTGEKLSVGISEDRGTSFTTHDIQISGSNSPHPVDPNPIIDNGKIRLTYLGNFNQGETGEMVTATSSDGINFTEDGVIYTGDAYDPDLFYDENAGAWVLLLNTGGLTKATASSSTATFTVDQSFSWTAGSISSTHKIDNKYYTYYTGQGGVSVAEYSGGVLTNVANGIVNYSGLNADPTVAVFGENDYKLFFKTQVN
jgi:hypothetical protein